MNQQTQRGVTVMALLGTASFLTIAGTAAAQTQGNPPPVEEVLVTGSLIRGAASVGIPITPIGVQDFRETGGVLLSDVLKNVPSIHVDVVNPINESGGSALHNENVVIHNVPSGNANETLLMIDGIRFPPQGLGFCVVDPSFIPQIAVDHIDVLADGASATYGSDALAGVVNVILKRGFDGAITQVSYGQSTDIAGATIDVAQLYGRKWGDGDVTVSYEFSHTNPVRGPARAYFTNNFEPFGFDDHTSIGNNSPGIVSTGDLQDANDPSGQFDPSVGTRFCGNCYSIPKGTGWNFGAQAPGPTTSWATLVANAGVKNEQNPEQYADVLPGQDRNGGTLTFDQDLFDGISVFGQAFYNNRRSFTNFVPGANPDKNQAIVAIDVPTSNPYYPTGAPSGLRVSYELGVEDNAVEHSGEIAEHYEFGLNAKLPDDWNGKVYYSLSRNGGYVNATNAINKHAIEAALGLTVTASPGTGSGFVGTFTKPANIPYLNLFCDPNAFACNSPATLAYINGHRNYFLDWSIGETGVNFDGPVIDLPGGTVKAAIGAVNYSNHNLYSQDFTVNSDTPTILRDPNSYTDWAVFAQTDIPLVGKMMNIPLIESLTVQVAGRYDRYNTFGAVWTPKMGVNWVVGWGFTIRGDWGKAFRAPIPAETSPVNGALDDPFNVGGGALFDLTCDPARGLPGGVAHPGTLDAYLNPTCSSKTAPSPDMANGTVNPGGITLSGGSGVSAAVRTGTGINPEKSVNWNLGFDFAPTDNFLKGLDVGVTWYNLRINGVISNPFDSLIGAGDNDPAAKVCTTPGTGCAFLVRARPDLPITAPENAVFAAMVNAELANPRSTLDPNDFANFYFIQDAASTNLGYEQLGGLDLSARYDFDLGDWGAWNVGATGNYQLLFKNKAQPGTSSVSQFFNMDSGGRMSYRGRLGWTDTEGPAEGLSITAFVNAIPHGPNQTTARNVPAPCFWQTGFGPGSCYPGSPFYGPYNIFPSFFPGTYTFDLSIGYLTGTRPANPYLQNINFQITVNDLFNKAPPFQIYDDGGRDAAAFTQVINPLQRYINFAVTKAW